MYAVVETGGKQYRVATGDKLEVEKLSVDVGQPFSIDKVLLVNNDGTVTLGAPLVEGASVDVDVLEHKKGDKVIAFKMRRRKGYRKKKGHRQHISVIQIKDIKSA
ncbi:MAG: 50S ribosomal protein L21 [Verrucomicrobiia bacterium]|jgi:large subunit ribosomal protein L21